MSPSLTALALSGLLALSSAAPLPPHQQQQPDAAVRRSPGGHPQLALARRPRTAPRAADELSVADHARARFAQHLARAGAHTTLAKLPELAATNGTSDTGAGTNVPVVNSVVSYIAQVLVGTPGTAYNLIVDTGSSNTWVGADKSNPYVKTSSSVATNEAVSVSYGSGQFNGSEFTDNVNIGSGLTIQGQSIGVADASVGFQGVDGIMGVGPTDLTTGTVGSAQQKSQTVPTVTDSLSKAGSISTESLGISFAPNTDGQDEQNGVLTFGGVDENAFVGELTFQPITSTAPASQFWGANISLSTASGKLTNSMAGIMDTGTSLFLVSSDVFQAYGRSIPGAQLDQSTGLIQMPIASAAKLPTINVEFGGASFPLTADAQVFPRALNTALGGSTNFAYSIISDLGTPSGEGLDFIFGMAALERFYMVVDTTNQQIGLAQTNNTNATFFDATATTAAGNATNDATTGGSTSGALASFRPSVAAAVGVVGALALLA